jgi:tetratricopeptide (TPR) repeat protein
VPNSKRAFRTCRILLRFVTIPLMTSMAAYGQSQSPATAPVKVYVAEFKLSGPSKTNFNQFARQMFELRLQAIPGLDVAEESGTTPCGASASSVAESPPGMAQSSDRKPTTASSPVFYNVQGTVDIHAEGNPAADANQSNILLAYELTKFKNCQATLLFRKTRTFSVADALQNLEDATEELSVRLSDDVAAKAAVEVDAIEAVGDPKGKYQADELLTRFVRQKVADADALRLWENTSPGKPAYTLKGRVHFLDPTSAGVKARVQFNVNDEPLPIAFAPRTIGTTSNDLISFYLDAASAAVKGLSDLVYKQRSGLIQTPAQGTDELIRRAKQLLCVDLANGSQGCSPDPQAALVALDEAQQKPDLANRAEAMALMGQASFQVQQYPAAGQAYDKALNAAGTISAEARLALLKNSADSWYEAKEYLKAAEHYRECVRMGTASQSEAAGARLQPEARVKLVHSLLLANQPQAALDALLDGLGTAHNWRNPDDTSKALYSNLREELNHVLDGLPIAELQPATAKLESQLAYDPDLEASALNQISRAYRTAGRYDESIAGYRKALSLKPDDADAHFNLAFSLNSKGQYKEAIAEYRKDLELEPNNAIARNNLGAALYGDGQYDAAILQYRHALKIKPDYAMARNNLTSALVDKGQFEEAEQLYRQSIQAQPNDSLAYFNLWWLYRRLSKKNHAKDIFDQLQKIARPDDQYAQLMLATSREDDEDFMGAAEIYSRLSQQHPEEPSYLANLASAEFSAGMKSQDERLVQKAKNRLDQEVSKNPSYIICFALAWAYQVVPSMRDEEKAAQLYQVALHYKPDDLTTLDNLAAIFLVKGDFQGVITQSGKALALNPRDLDALENMGYAQFLAGDPRGAVETYKKGLEFAKGDPALRICLGEALFWSGDTPKGREEFEHARTVLSRPGPAGGTWIWLINPRYDATEKQRPVYYSTISQKKALVEFFDAMTYLRETNVVSALDRYKTATDLLTAAREDKEIVRKAINDLHRLGRESLAQPTAEFGLGCLHDWLGETENAAKHWELYVKSGADPVAVLQGRRRCMRTK